MVKRGGSKRNSRGRNEKGSVEKVLKNREGKGNRR